MKQRAWALCLALCLMLTGCVALADWSAPTAQLSAYTAAYGDAAEGYKAIRYGAESAQVAAVKTALSSLGYYPFQATNSYTRSLERAVRLFAAQMRIGDSDGREITPLMQAMLADAANLPPAVSPVINTADYTADPDNSGYTPYAYARVTRTSVQQDTKVGFDGTISAWTREGDTHHYVVQMENDPAKVVYVTYQPLPRTTVFQPGDRVSVFGTTQGLQNPYPGMAEAALTVAADRIGYTPQ